MYWSLVLRVVLAARFQLSRSICCLWNRGGRLPLIVSHRAGATDYPENTLLAINESLSNQADIIWLTVQLSRDGVPVLYRPSDLAINTQGTGPIAARTFNELQQLNAGWRFERIDAYGVKTYPYRAQRLEIPSLKRALMTTPDEVPLILDMKTLPAEPQARAVAQVLDELHAWSRVRIYSTDASYQRAFASYPAARLFESRDDTRSRLVSVALAQDCTVAPAADAWVAFEYRRKVQLVETFTLGEARSPVNALLWTPASIGCFRSKGEVTIVGIGIDSAEDYRAAACLGIDAVLANSPQNMRAIKEGLKTPLHCTDVSRLSGELKK